MNTDFIQFLKQLPFSRLIFPLLIGIILALNFSVNFEILVVLFILILILFILGTSFIFKKNKFSLRWFPGLLINILLVTGGALLLQVNKAKKIEHYNALVTGEAVISEPLVEKENSYKSTLNKFVYRYNDTVFEEHSGIIVYFSKNKAVKNLKYGDKIFFQGRINEIKNPGNPHEFDYKKYLARKGITGQIFLKPGTWRYESSNHGNFIFEKAYDFRNRLENIYENSGISGKELSVLQALTLGDKSDIDDEIRQSYVASGAMHILAVSGLHVGIIFMIFNFLLKFLDKLKYKDKYYGKIIKAILLLVIIWSFAVLSGLSPSIRRAALMFSFIIIAKAKNRHVNIYNSISASAFVLLIINPYQITEVGFQLSYAAVLGIVFFQPKLVSLLKINNRVLYYLWSLTAVSIAAQISTFPITLYYFHIFPTLFFLSNIIVIPAATLIIILAFFLLISSPVPFISVKIAFILKYILKILNASVGFIEDIPYSTINNISFHTEDMLFAFLFIISLSVFLLLKRVRALQISLLIVILWISSGSFRKFSKNNRKELVVYNINKFTAVDIITGNENYFLSDKSIFNTKNIAYGIQPGRQYLNKTNFQFIPVDTSEFKSDFIFKKEAFTAIGERTFLFFTNEDQKIPNTEIKADYVVLSGKSNISLKKLIRTVRFDTLILDSSNDYYRLKKRQKTCKQLNINCISIKDSGAFILFF